MTSCWLVKRFYFSMDKTPKLEVKNLYKIFGDNPHAAFKQLQNHKNKDQIFADIGQTVAVCDVNLRIYEGEIFVVMGLSGSGKSTLVRLLNRLIEPTQGQVLIDNEDVTQMTKARLREVRRQKISMVFQSFALMPHLSILENAAFGLLLAGVDEHERNQKALAALEQVGLAAHAESYPDQLSGGMKQRVGLARALANNPDILLMDEAFSALDPLIRTEMQDELIALQKRERRTIIFISHDLNEAMRIGDRIAIMQGGNVVQVGSPDEILKHPKNEYVRSFFKEVDISQVFTAGDIAKRTQLTFARRSEATDGARTFLKLMNENDRDFAYLLDEDSTFLGVVSAGSLQETIRQNRSIQTAILPEIKAVNAATHIRDIIGLVAKSPCPLPVVSDKGRHIGCISHVMMLETLSKESEYDV